MCPQTFGEIRLVISVRVTLRFWRCAYMCARWCRLCCRLFSPHGAPLASSPIDYTGTNPPTSANMHKLTLLQALSAMDVPCCLTFSSAFPADEQNSNSWGWVMLSWCRTGMGKPALARTWYPLVPLIGLRIWSRPNGPLMNGRMSIG